MGACNKGKNESEICNIKMRVEANKIEIGIAGEGYVTINWGDGDKQTRDIESSKRLKHDYLGKSGSCIVKITGTNIMGLSCNFNQLTNLEMSDCTKLTELCCRNNHLTSLDMSSCNELTYLDCSDNRLTSEALNDLFETLHSNTGDKVMYIHGNPGKNTCNQSIATRKGWRIYLIEN
jgi:hypothetical protein